MRQQQKLMYTFFFWNGSFQNWKMLLNTVFTIIHQFIHPSIHTMFVCVQRFAIMWNDLFWFKINDPYQTGRFAEHKKERELYEFCRYTKWHLAVAFTFTSVFIYKISAHLVFARIKTKNKHQCSARNHIFRLSQYNCTEFYQFSGEEKKPTACDIQWIGIRWKCVHLIKLWKMWLWQIGLDSIKRLT